MVSDRNKNGVCNALFVCVCVYVQVEANCIRIANGTNYKFVKKNHSNGKKLRFHCVNIANRYCIYTMSFMSGWMFHYFKIQGIVVIWCFEWKQSVFFSSRLSFKSSVCTRTQWVLHWCPHSARWNWFDFFWQFISSKNGNNY